MGLGCANSSAISVAGPSRHLHSRHSRDAGSGQGWPRFEGRGKQESSVRVAAVDLQRRWVPDIASLFRDDEQIRSAL